MSIRLVSATSSWLLIDVGLEKTVLEQPPRLLSKEGASENKGGRRGGGGGSNAAKLNS